MNRRDILTRTAGLMALAALGGCAAKTAREPALKPADISIPGYKPQHARFQSVPALDHPHLRRAIPKGYDQNITMLTKFGLDGSIRQALFPVRGHDIAISPDKHTGLFGAMEWQTYVTFDPATLDLRALGKPFRTEWIGGGHGAFLDDRLVAVTERAPKRPYSGRAQDHFGRVTLRDPETLRIVEDFSTHGIAPHEMRLLDDGKHAVIANYGTTIPPNGGSDYGLPRHIVEASVTVVEIASGKLVEKYRGNKREELRHLAARDRDTIFAIQTELVRETARPRTTRQRAAAHGPAPGTGEGSRFNPAPTLYSRASEGRLSPAGGTADHSLMRHGLSIEYDPTHDEVIASYPDTHMVMVFDASSGARKRRIACDRDGLHYPCGIALLPGQNFYVVAGYWQNLFVYERGTHRLMRALSHYPVNFGHSHIVAA